jgi:DNA-directed RNA polymerase specialized sigma24 family protein
VESAPFPRSKWNLTQNAFDLLLAQLDADRHEAGNKYEALRRKLIKFFEWRGCSFPEDLADETINRVARNLETGEQIHHFVAYCVGTARHVFLESLRNHQREEALQATPQSLPPSVEEQDLRRGCLECCLRELSQEDLNLIVEYYQEDKQARINARRNLAARLDIPLNALRIRTYRIRVRLEGCVDQCMRRLPGEGETNELHSHSKVKESRDS